MKKSKVLLILFAVCSVFAFTNVAYAQCSGSNQAACEAQTEDGYKCKWDMNKKGGARCGKSKELAEEAIEEANKTYTSCNQIKEHDACTASKINGYSCIWRQGACYDNKVPEQDEDTSNKVAGNKSQATQKYTAAPTQKPTQNSGTTGTDSRVVGANFCDEEEAIKALKAVGYLLFIAKIMVPLIIVGIGTWDLVKAVQDPDKALSKSVKALLIRVALGVLIFFIPRIVYVVLDGAEKFGVMSSESANCRKALLDPWNMGLDTGDIKKDE